MSFWPSNWLGVHPANSSFKSLNLKPWIPDLRSWGLGFPESYGYPQSSSISRWDVPWNKPTSYWDTPHGYGKPHGLKLRLRSPNDFHCACLRWESFQASSQGNPRSDQWGHIKTPFFNWGGTQNFELGYNVIRYIILIIYVYLYMYILMQAALWFWCPKLVGFSEFLQFPNVSCINPQLCTQKVQELREVIEPSTSVDHVNYCFITR